MDSTNKPKSDITLYNRAPLLSEMIKNTWSALIWVTCFFMNIDTGVYFEPIPRSPYLQYNATNLWLKIVSNKSLVWVMFAKKTLKKEKRKKETIFLSHFLKRSLSSKGTKGVVTVSVSVTFLFFIEISQQLWDGILRWNFLQTFFCPVRKNCNNFDAWTLPSSGQTKYLHSLWHSHQLWLHFALVLTSTL